MTKSKENENTEKPAVTEKAVKPAVPKYTLEKLRENCMNLFGVSSSTFDGAAYGLDGSYTISDMKNIINKWNSKEVI